MRSILALVRVKWLSFTSYRLNGLFAVIGLIALLVPLYFVANALDPVVADSIANEGGDYFGFLITGMIGMQLIGTGMRVLPNAVSSGIVSGTLEALLATPAGLFRLMAGLQGFDLLWAATRGALLFCGYLVLGGDVSWSGVPMGLVVLALLVVAHMPVGLLATAMILVFRTAGPLIQGVASAVSLLGGVYYSTSVIPEVIRPVADFIPLTYGLRALRRLVLDGAPFSQVAGDVAMLTVMAAGLMAGGIVVVSASLRYARRAGSLAQY